MTPLKCPYRSLTMICNTTRPPGAPKASCGDHGADELRRWLKKTLKAEGLWGQARVVTSSCLDICPKAGVVVSLDGGRTLHLLDTEQDREALLTRIRRSVAE